MYTHVFHLSVAEYRQLCGDSYEENFQSDSTCLSLTTPKVSIYG